jgi:DNA-binding NarL/FixJ family response regulator
VQAIGAAAEHLSADRSPEDILVALAPTLGDRLDDLATILGTGFAVELGVPEAGAVAVLRAPTPTTVAFWRARYPDCGLLVVDPFGETPAVACLEAGADDYVTGPVTAAELAARVRSLARRSGAVRLPA